MEFHTGLSVVLYFSISVKPSRLSWWSSLIHISPLSSFISNYNMPGELLMQASLEETVNINITIILLNSNIFITAQHPCHTGLCKVFFSRLFPSFTFVSHCLWTSFVESVPPLFRLLLVSLPLRRDVMSLIAARWRGAWKNRINLVSPEPSLFLSSIRCIN